MKAWPRTDIFDKPGVLARVARDVGFTQVAHEDLRDLRLLYYSKPLSYYVAIGVLLCGFKGAAMNSRIL